MSFWLDDDDIDDGPLSNLMSQSQSQSQQLSQEQSQSQSQRRLSQATAAVWHCEECGGLESYTDGATGSLICSDCFTTSQKKNDDQTDMDYDDVMGLAAKTRGGALVQQRRSRKSVSGGDRNAQNQKHPLEELDKSEVLPDLEQCIAGFMTVCRELIRILVQDLRVFGSHDGDNNEQTMAATILHLEKTVETMFQTYLRAWADGAEHYGELAPEVRFSMRDCFLNMQQRELIYRLVSDRVDKEEAKKNRNNNDDDDDDGSSSDSSSDSNTSRNLLESDNEDDVEGDSGEDGDDPTNRRSQSKQYCSFQGMIGHVLKIHTRTRRKGRKEAALSLPPTMSMAAALVFLAVHRRSSTTTTTKTDSSSLSTAAASPPMIVTSRQFVAWIVSGSLPIYSTFSLLTPEQQIVLRHVKAFFTCTVLPTVSSLETTATLWTVACGLKSVSQWNGTHTYLEPAVMEARRVAARIEKITPRRTTTPRSFEDPFDGLSDFAKRFLATMKITTAEKLLSSSTADISVSFVDWRIKEDMPELKGRGAAIAVNNWKGEVRKFAKEMGLQDLADMGARARGVSRKEVRSAEEIAATLRRRNRTTTPRWFELEDPFDGLSNFAKRFLATMKITTAEKLLSSSTADISVNFVDWRIKEDMPELKGRGAAIEVDSWKGKVRKFAKEMGLQDLADLDARKVSMAEVSLPEVQLAADVAATVAVGRLVFDPVNLDVDQRLLLEFLAYTSRLDAELILEAYAKVFRRFKGEAYVNVFRAFRGTRKK